MNPRLKQEREVSLPRAEPEAKAFRKRQSAGSVDDGGRPAGENEAGGHVRGLARGGRLNTTSEAAGRATSGGRGAQGVVARDQHIVATQEASSRKRAGGGKGHR